MPELIYKQDALRLCKDADWKDDECFIVGYNFAMREMAESIEELPIIEAKPVRRGRWIPTEYDSYADGAPVWDKWECSVCGHEHSGEEDTLTAFCPDCGADMREGGADNG